MSAKRKRQIITVLVILALAALVYLQFRTWKRFDWAEFGRQTSLVNPWRIAAGVALIYLDYFLRAVRWKIFLKANRPSATATGLAPAQFIGFTGLALLGRPGEFIRPYLIAKRENVTFSSQLAVWAVERIFDTGAFAVLMAINIVAFGPVLKTIPYFAQNPVIFERFREFGFLLLVGVVIAAAVAIFIRKKTSQAAYYVRKWFSHAPHVGHKLAHKIEAFGHGLNTLHDVSSFIQLCLISIVIWVVIALAYVQVTHAYPAAMLGHMTLTNVLLLMAASISGSVLQLPMVGGGSQLATIAVLKHIFDVPPEIAVSCGMMLWLVTFVSVTPAGLFLAHREHVSLTQISRESAEEDAEAEG